MENYSNGLDKIVISNDTGSATVHFAGGFKMHKTWNEFPEFCRTWKAAYVRHAEAQEKAKEKTIEQSPVFKEATKELKKDAINRRKECEKELANKRQELASKKDEKKNLDGFLTQIQQSVRTLVETKVASAEKTIAEFADSIKQVDSRIEVIKTQITTLEGEIKELEKMVKIFSA